MLPYVKKHAIMTMFTPIGSAGSCFAFEIARYFQQEGYNYVITKRNDTPNSGMHVDGYNPGDEIAKFCANYGILFNTPSFCQLANEDMYYLPSYELVTECDSDAWEADTRHVKSPTVAKVVAMFKAIFVSDAE
ncbi:MAG: hypothetical protein ACI936_001311 [Paraglaciecola sp.]|jgi:hypothetical protein